MKYNISFKGELNVDEVVDVKVTSKKGDGMSDLGCMFTDMLQKAVNPNKDPAKKAPDFNVEKYVNSLLASVLKPKEGDKK